MFSLLSALGGVWGGTGELRFWGDVGESEGLKGSRTDWLVSSGSTGGSGGNGIQESAVVHWFTKES